MRNEKASRPDLFAWILCLGGMRFFVGHQEICTSYNVSGSPVTPESRSWLLHLHSMALLAASFGAIFHALVCRVQNSKTAACFSSGGHGAPNALPTTRSLVSGCNALTQRGLAQRGQRCRQAALVSAQVRFDVGQDFRLNLPDVRAFEFFKGAQVTCQCAAACPARAASSKQATSSGFTAG